MEFKVGKLTFKVWQLGDGRYAFDYTIGSKRKVVARRNPDDLKAEAVRLSADILNGRTEALDLTQQDQRIYIAARKVLEGTGYAVDQACRELAEVIKIAGTEVSPREIAQFYKRQGAPGDVATMTVKDCYGIFLKDKTEKELSGRQKRDLKNDGTLFVRTFGPTQISEITPDEVLTWLRRFQSSEHKPKPVGWRRRNNIHATVTNMFRYAKRKGYLPNDRDSAPERVERLPEPRRRKPVEIFSPIEMRAWIAQIKPQYFPWLAIGGFSGVRSEEIAPDPHTNKDPLRWEDFDWHQKVIRIRSETSKINEARLVPISDNLAAFLAVYVGRTGLVCPGTQPTKRETGRLSKTCGVEIDGRWVKPSWKQNALRHSYASYRLAVVKNRAQVALEIGSSEKMIKKHYDRVVTESEGSAWFALMPAEIPGNVLQHKFAGF